MDLYATSCEGINFILYEGISVGNTKLQVLYIPTFEKEATTRTGKVDN
jgi:hypothetical protein